MNLSQRKTYHYLHQLNPVPLALPFLLCFVNIPFVRKTINLSIPEMGMNGSAKVLAIMPTKADSRKNTDPRYKPVTSNFVHDNAEVINLYFTHQETEPLGVTSNHLL